MKLNKRGVQGQKQNTRYFKSLMIYNNFIHGDCICNQLPLVKWFLSGDPDIQLPQTEILVENLT